MTLRSAVFFAALSAAVPSVAVAQDDGANEEAETEEAEEGTEEPQATASDRTAAFVDRRVSSGLGFQLTLGALAGIRRMSFAGSTREIVHSPGPYVGGVLEGSQLVWTFDETKSHFLVEAEAGYATAKDTEPDPNLNRPLASEHAYLYLTGVLEKPLSQTVDLRLGLGAGAQSFTVQPNPRYTGHRYLTLVAHFGAVKWLDKGFRAGGGITFFPGIATNQSDGGYGAARSFGGRGEAHGTWRFFQPDAGDMFGTAEATLRYSLTRFRTTMPTTQAVGDQAGSDDTQHILSLMVSYFL